MDVNDKYLIGLMDFKRAFILEPILFILLCTVVFWVVIDVKNWPTFLCCVFGFWAGSIRAYYWYKNRLIKEIKKDLSNS